MIETDSKIEPVVGMAVTWIDPNDDPPNATFIESSLVAKCGKDGLTVGTIIQAREDCLLVTLVKDGQPILGKWDKNWGPQPADFREMVREFNWRWLRPLEAS